MAQGPARDTGRPATERELSLLEESQGPPPQAHAAAKRQRPLAEAAGAVPAPPPSRALGWPQTVSTPPPEGAPSQRVARRGPGRDQAKGVVFAKCN